MKSKAGRRKSGPGLKGEAIPKSRISPGDYEGLEHMTPLQQKGEVVPLNETMVEGSPTRNPIGRKRGGKVHRADGGGNWIAGAIKHPGSESAAAKKAGMSTHAYAEEHKHDSGKAGKRARLALTFEKIRPH